MQFSAIIAIVIGHFIGDWLLQTREMALNKSKDVNWLLMHLGILSIPIFIVSFSLHLSYNLCAVWFLTNIILHGIQDWNIWRIAGYFLAKTCKTKEEAWNTSLFWNVVGLDIALHYCVYFTSYWLLLKIS